MLSESQTKSIFVGRRRKCLLTLVQNNMSCQTKNVRFWLPARSSARSEHINAALTLTIDLSMRGTKTCAVQLKHFQHLHWHVKHSPIHVLHTLLTSASGFVRSRSVTRDTVTTEPSNEILATSIATNTHQRRTFIDICKTGHDIEQLLNG